MACNITTSTLSLYVDDMPVLLYYAGLTGAGVPHFITGPGYAIDVNGSVGRTIKLQVVGNGISLTPPNPALVHCTGYTSRYVQQVDFNHIVCYHANPANVVILPGGAVDKFGIIFHSSQSPQGESCPFIVSIRVRRTAPLEVCKVKCISESVEIPNGIVQALVNDVGYQYNLVGYNYTECHKESQSTVATCEAIRQLIVGTMKKCTDPGVRVFYENNPLSEKCVKITILNSPIRFNYIKVADKYYDFVRTGC